MSGLGLQLSKFCQITTELWPLIYVQILHFPQNLLNKWMNFDKILCNQIHQQDLGLVNCILFLVWPLTFVKIDIFF